MFEAPDSPYLVPFDESFRIADASTSPTTDGPPHQGEHRQHLTGELKLLQRLLAAGDRHAVLLVFQAMDAAGKDGMIRAVLRGVVTVKRFARTKVVVDSVECIRE